MKVITTITSLISESRHVHIRWWVGKTFDLARPHGVLIVNLSKSKSPDYEDVVRAHLYAFDHLMLVMRVCSAEDIHDGRAITWLTSSDALLAFLHESSVAIMSGTMVARHFPVRFKGFHAEMTNVSAPEDFEWEDAATQVLDYTKQVREFVPVPMVGDLCITRRGLVTFNEALLKDSHEGVVSPFKALNKRLCRADFVDASVPESVLLKRGAKYFGKVGYLIRAFHNSEIPNIYFLIVKDPKGDSYLLDAYHWKPGS